MINNKHFATRHPYQSGSLLIGMVALIVTISLLGATISHLFISKTRGGVDVSNGNEALILAESGIEQAKYALSLNSSYSGETNTSFSAGSFTIAILNTDFDGAALPSDQVRISSTGTLTSAGGTQAIRTTEAIVAIGSGYHDDGWAVGDNSITLQWDGLNWNSISNPGSNNLKDVFCNTISDCWTVGNNGTIMRWDGSAWSTVSSGTSNGLKGISCDPNNASHCFAVGDSATILYWNGSNWSSIANPAHHDLESVNCPSSVCYAVGEGPTILRYDTGATNWIDESFGSEDLKGVNCTSDSDCLAVGKDTPTEYYILERSSGSWSDTSYAHSHEHDLSGVACVNPSDGRCWAVGDDGKTTFYDGSSWSYISTSSSRDLKDVWCSQFEINCWAVGKINGSNFTILRWQGGSWVQVSLSLSPARDLEGIHFPPTGGGSDIITVVAWRELAP